MKILMIQARTTETPEGPIFPIGLASLAAVLKDHELRAVDMNTEADPYAAIRAAATEFKPDFVALSIRNIKVCRPGAHESSIDEIRDMTRGIRAAIPAETRFIAGGTGFSLFAERIMRDCPEIDAGICGEGELALPRLLAAWPALEGIPGVLYRRDGQVRAQGMADRPDFGALPWPRRDLFPVHIYRRNPAGIGVMTKRGCPFSCIHCSDQYLLGRSMRCRKPADVVAELRDLRDRYGVRQFMFSDQEFNVPPAATKEILRAMIAADLGLVWTAYFTPAGVDAEMLTLMKQAGCAMLNFSPDCCDDRVLKGLKKGITMADVNRVNRLVREVRLPVVYNFMLGLPGEDPLAILRTCWFVVKTKLMLGPLFRLHGLFFVPARIYPHTELRELAVKEGALRPDDDLLVPRFATPRSKAVRLLDRAVEGLVVSLWKLKRVVGGKRPPVPPPPEA